MAHLDEDILAHINALSDASESEKEFLKWLLSFERDNDDKAQPAFKAAIDAKLNELIK